MAQPQKRLFKKFLCQSLKSECHLIFLFKSSPNELIRRKKMFFWKLLGGTPNGSKVKNRRKWCFWRFHHYLSFCEKYVICGTMNIKSGLYSILWAFDWYKVIPRISKTVVAVTSQSQNLWKNPDLYPICAKKSVKLWKKWT